MHCIKNGELFRSLHPYPHSILHFYVRISVLQNIIKCIENSEAMHCAYAKRTKNILRISHEEASVVKDCRNETAASNIFDDITPCISTFHIRMWHFFRPREFTFCCNYKTLSNNCNHSPQCFNFIVRHCEPNLMNARRKDCFCP